MHINPNISYAMRALAVMTVIATLLTSCGSPKSAIDTTATDASVMVNTEQHLAKVSANNSTQTYLTSKVKVVATADGNRVTTSGTLRMKRDDVIQLILVDPLIGALELGRMEFTRSRVLIIDKVNKQYVDVPYSDVGFLQKAGINFSTMQSLFWNEVFTPGESQARASDFSLTADGSYVVLTHAARILTYQFTTQRKSGLLSKTEITGSTDQTYKFDFTYNNFQTYEGRPFPKDMTMAFYIDGQPATLSLSLSSMRNSSDWATRSNVSSKFTKADPELIFKMLVK